MLPAIPPVSPYGTLYGSIFQYKGNLVAFESTPPPASLPASDSESTPVVLTPPPSKCCILLGGLSDGLLPTPYTQKLEAHCHELGWSLVQPILSSSYLGFGNSDLFRDSEELSALLWYLTCHRSAEIFAIVGHSTGCQISVHFLKNGIKEMIERTKLVVLQAPVSDREHEMISEPKKYEENIAKARHLVFQEDKPTAMMPRNVFWAPITAKRFLDLQEKGGTDDYFSSDYTDQELKERLGHITPLRNNNLKVLIAFSGSDEYVPKEVDSKLLTERLCRAINDDDDDNDNNEDSTHTIAQGLYLPNANHNLSQSEGDLSIFVNKVAELLKEVKS